MLQLPPLSLYIHFPWCIQKCPYCDFNSHTLKTDLPEKIYIKQLLADLEADLAYIQQRAIQSIFLGGGTPSLFSPTAIHDLLQALKQRLSFTENIEITLEANPGTVEQGHFQGYFAAGINRLSLGIQSLNDLHLKTLGRIHNGQTASQAIEKAYNAGFNNVNLDLMFGLPQQTIAQALDDLAAVISFAPAHISWYQLTLEPNTLFFKYPPVLPKHDDIARMHSLGIELLQQSHFQQYEVSAFSKARQYCQHNLNYWRYGDYLGIGAGAHSKITLVDENKIVRLLKFKQPKTYLDATDDFIQKTEFIPVNERIFEFMLNALRLFETIKISDFEDYSGVSVKTVLPTLQRAAAKQLLIFNDETIRTTTLGKQFLNDLIEMFLSPQATKC
ncbi:MAG: radical SAM family heme chaperone HemW [Pseudomonadota bacterium]